MVGEPVAYATGSHELKAMGPFRDGFELPDLQGSKSIMRGRTAGRLAEKIIVRHSGLHILHILICGEDR